MESATRFLHVAEQHPVYQINYVALLTINCIYRASMMNAVEAAVKKSNELASIIK